MCKKTSIIIALMIFMSFSLMAIPPLGLPKLKTPSDNPMTPEKIALGDRLFHDTRFSADQKISCATCHDKNKGFTDNLAVSTGFRGQTGTRNAPTVINSAYMKSMFWDGREPSLERQSLGPPINPVEGGLHSHEPIIKVIQADKKYVKQFKKVFGVTKSNIT
ncbi:MAG TPA: cytochrome-c peroxidase, partial [Oceanospirillales bacterium]|nr:cytochrome-c peroxidase [Oceanospirillales bacterium]